MADTFSTSIKARRIEQAAYSASGYADPLNEGVVDVLDAVASGTITIDIGSDTTYLMAPMQNGVVSESHYKRIVFIGTPASAVTIIVPDSVDVFKEYVADNQTGQLIVIKYDSTPGVRIPNGVAVLIQADGEYVEQYEIGNAVTDAEVSAAAPLLDPVYTPANPWRYGSNGEDGAEDDDALNAVAAVLAAAVGLSGWKNGLSVPGYSYIQAERSCGILPSEIDYRYSVEPYVDIRRYGAKDGSDSTAAVQRAMTVAQFIKGTVLVPIGVFLCDALSLTFAGNQYNSEFRMKGCGAGSRIKKSGSPSALITIQGSSPTGDPTDAGQLTFQDFCIEGDSANKAGYGFRFVNIAPWRLSGVIGRFFNTAVRVDSALIGLIDQQCLLTDNVSALVARRTGSGPYGSTTNLITVRDSRITGNSGWAIDFNGGAGLCMDGNDTEGNGTAGDINSGAVIIRGQLAPDALVSKIELRDWMENNKGYQLFVEASTNGCVSTIVFHPRTLVSSESGRAIQIEGATNVDIANVQCGPGEIWNITSTHSKLSNCGAPTINDYAAYPIWENVSDSSGEHGWGRPSSFAFALTGMSTGGTGTMLVFQQGTRVRLEVRGSITGTSNLTTCAINAGVLPVGIRPSLDRTFQMWTTDNGVSTSALVTAGADGSLILRKGDNASGFTASGSKGFASGHGEYLL